MRTNPGTGTAGSSSGSSRTTSGFKQVSRAKNKTTDPNQQAAAQQDTREQQKRETYRVEKTVDVTTLVRAEAVKSTRTVTERMHKIAISG